MAGFAGESALFDLKAPARCLVEHAPSAHLGHRFLAATSALGHTGGAAPGAAGGAGGARNAVVVLRVAEAGNDVAPLRAYAAPPDVAEFVALAPPPNAESSTPELVFCVVADASGKRRAELFRMEGAAGEAADDAPPAALDAPADALAALATLDLPEGGGQLNGVVWSPHAEGTVLVAEEGGVSLHKLRGGGASAERAAAECALPRSALPADSTGAAHAVGAAAAWDPHHPKCVAAAAGDGVRSWDVRAKKSSYAVAEAHTAVCRALDYNPNKPWQLATGGDDCLVKCWDLRRTAQPLVVLDGHSHWWVSSCCFVPLCASLTAHYHGRVWSVRYNRFHDQLLVSGGSDGAALLWRASSISSAPLMELDDDAGAERSATDVLVKRCDEHEDSVYSTAWSANSAWLFASLSYSGRVLVTHVPAPEKYKILL